MNMNGKKYKFYKRLLDLIVSLLILLLLFPIMILIFLIVAVQFKHFPIFRQKRLGQNGKVFNIYKFQTMYDDSDIIFNSFSKELKKEFYINYKLDNDPRVTKLGKILRKLSIDELPQLFNVLKGDMSLIGPRPIIKTELLKYVGFEKKFLSVKPGMTGLWQVNGDNITTYEQRVMLDMKYINDISFKTDIKIFFKTFQTIKNRIKR